MITRFGADIPARRIKVLPKRVKFPRPVTEADRLAMLQQQIFMQEQIRLELEEEKNSAMNWRNSISHNRDMGAQYFVQSNAMTPFITHNMLFAEDYRVLPFLLFISRLG